MTYNVFGGTTINQSPALSQTSAHIVITRLVLHHEGICLLSGERYKLGKIKWMVWQFLSQMKLIDSDSRVLNSRLLY